MAANNSSAQVFAFCFTFFLKSSPSILVVSGFYVHDIADIEDVAKAAGLVKTKMESKNNWAAVVFERK